MKGRKRLPSMVAALCAMTLLAGCVVSVDSDTHYRRGALAKSDALDAIAVGHTTRDWVVDHLGQPNSVYTNDDGNEVLRYLSRRESDVEVHLFFLFSIDASEEETHTLHIEIEDAVVKGYWIER